MQDLHPCMVSTDSEMSWTLIVPGLLSSVHGQWMGEDCWIQARVHWSVHWAQKVDLSTFPCPEQFLNTLLQRLCYSCCQHRKPLQNAPTTEQISLLGIAVSRPVFSKRMNQKSYRLQCAILATVFETSWLKGWIVCSERWPLHHLDNGI